MVSDLNLKIETGWQICCTVTKKHPIKTHSTGKLFKIDLIDD